MAWAVGLMATTTLMGQNPDTSRVYSADGYVEKMDQYLTVEAYANNNFETFQVSQPGQTIELSPNLTTKLGLGINYRFVSGAYSIAPAFIPGNNDNELKGKTKSWTFNFNLIFKHLFLLNSVGKTRGFYLSNTPQLDPSWQEGDPYITAPDLTHFTVNITAGYSFNERFSLRHLINQTERQVKSTGTWMPITTLRYYETYGGNPQMSQNYEWTAGGAAFYTWIPTGYWYVTAGGLVSGGMVHSTLKTPVGNGMDQTYQNNPLFRWEGRAGLGYNGPRFYAQVNAGITGIEFDQEQSVVHNSDTRFLLATSVGWRFQLPQRWNATFDRWTDWIPFL